MTAWFNFPPFRVIPVGPFAIQVWGSFVALGVLAATTIAARRARRAGIAPRVIWDLAFSLVLAGIVGARLLYVVEYWRDFLAAPWRVVAIWEGGMSAFGSVVLGLAAAWWFARRRNLSFSSLATVVGPSLLLGDAVGRLGGAASHMYVGTPTTFPISYVLDGVQRHEVGIELALASFIGFLFVLWAEKHWSFVIGHWSFPAPLVLVWYSLERFLLDFLRASDLPQSDLRYGGLTLAQYFSLVGIAVAVVLASRAHGIGRGRVARSRGPAPAA